MQVRRLYLGFWFSELRLLCCMLTHLLARPCTHELACRASPRESKHMSARPRKHCSYAYSKINAGIVQLSNRRVHRRRGQHGKSVGSQKAAPSTPPPHGTPFCRPPRSVFALLSHTSLDVLIRPDSRSLGNTRGRCNLACSWRGRSAHRCTKRGLVCKAMGTP